MLKGLHLLLSALAAQGSPCPISAPALGLSLTVLQIFLRAQDSDHRARGLPSGASCISHGDLEVMELD